MLKEDGYSLIQPVRSLNPEQGGQIPAIALTASARVEDWARALTIGFQMHVAKLVHLTELAMTIASLTKRTQQN